MCKSRIGLLENVPDGNFDSSSDNDPGHGPQQSRLSTTCCDLFWADAWMSSHWYTVDQWIEVDFSERKTIKAVEVRPRTVYEQWVSSYKLAFSNDGNEYSFLKTANKSDLVFRGPSGMGDFVTSSFEPTYARYIHLYPITYHGFVSVKWEVYGC